MTLRLRKFVEIQERRTYPMPTLYRVPRYRLVTKTKALTISKAVFQALKCHGIPVEKT